jgi:hypothetical protein
MFSANDIINLKEVVYHQGSWDQHTNITIEGSNRGYHDESAIKTYAKMLSNAISGNTSGECHVAEKETDNSYSIFQLVEKSCIAGNFSSKKSSSNVEIFSSKKLDLEEVLRITREFFNCDGLEVTTFSKIS